MPVMPINTLRGKWTRISATERLQRSSQVLSVIDQTICIYGGEVQSRKPVDSQVDIMSLKSASDHRTEAASSAPSPRVGTASAVLDGKMYIFSGRGGVNMSPIEEEGAIWSFDPSNSAWKQITHRNSSSPYPPARSYHSSTSDGKSSFFVHAGCSEKDRLSDLWRFDDADRTWTQLPDAPAPARGGTSIAYSDGKLYRMNGFDGSTEQGGSIDIFDLSSKSWSTKTFKPNGNDGPIARSVTVLLPMRLAQKDKLLTCFGERDPSSLGHAGAGKMLSDVWIYDIAENWWTQISPEGEDGSPTPRGWFDADVVRNADGNDSVVLHGGLGDDNQRLNDVWLLSF